MKKLFFCTLALCAVSYGTYAQESARTDGDSRRLDSLQRAVEALSSRVEDTERTELNRAVWKDRAKYFNLGYVRQKLADKTYGGELESDFGASLSWGKTYYLHRKPLFGMLKFGLDWSWMDINYAKSAIEMFDESSSEDFSSDVHQAEIGMQFGPSVTVNPVHHLKIGGYFRVTPSYSLLYMDETVHHHYVTFCNAGCTLAWKVVSLGVEWRWGTAKYDGLKFDESAFDEDDLTDGDADLFAALERTALVGQVILACTDAQDGEAGLYAVFLQFFRLCMEPLGQRLGDLGSLEQHSHGKNSSSDRRGHPRSYP